jgi:hypothetical protein
MATADDGNGPDGGCSIVRCFWKHNLDDSHLSRYQQFLSFYKTELSKERWSNPVKPRGGLKATGVSQDVEVIASVLSKNRELGVIETQTKIRAILPSRSEEEVSMLTVFVLRVWLTLNAREISQGSPTNHIPVCNWDKKGMP